MKCPACGDDNRDGARFCRGCGAQLLQDGADPAAASEKLPPENQEAAVVSPDASELPADESPVGGQIEDVSAEEVVAKNEEVIDAGAEPQPAETGEGEPVSAGLPEEHASFGAGATEDGDEGYEPLEEEDDDILTFWRDEAEPMTPVETGTVLEDRYVIEEALDVQSDEILYRGLDLWRCWQCGYEGNDPEGAFCGRCGVLMDHRPEVRLLEVQDPDAQPSTDNVVVKRLSQDSRHFLIVVEPEPGPPPITEVLPLSPSVRFLVGQRSDPGQVRDLDEDSMLVLTMAPTYESRTGPVIGLYSVADGMGGHAGGEVASKMALQVLAEHVLKTVILPELAGELVLEEDILTFLRQGTIAANDVVYLTRQKRENDMGTTLTTALIRDSRLFLAHVGDCRAYHWSVNGLEQLTTDHSVVANMIAKGQLEPEELYTHPHRSIVTRCIGDKPVVEVDTDMLPVGPGDRIIICCDGLWELVRDEGIEDVMLQEADPQMACDILVRRANAVGGDDNISVIVVQVEAVSDLEE